MTFVGAVEDGWQLYSDDESDYTIGALIGFGASSVVYSAVFQPPYARQPSIPCALKVLDLDRLPPRALQLLQRETQLMSLSKHPNVLRVRGSWITGHKLYIAMRLMNSGSASDVMRYGWPGGMEEEVIKTILKQALKGLNYLHINGLVHRDVKAANLLIDDDGTVLLGDLGVATFLWDSEESSSSPDRRRGISFESTTVYNTHSRAPLARPGLGKRKSFVGTPCWMAPEVIEGRKYDSKADIWSFGITALELAQGRPPRSKYSPQNVLLKTVQDLPPTLDRKAGPYKYSHAFQDVVESCLVKDPVKRPTAAQLLQLAFFRGAKRKTHLVNTVLKGLPPLSQRQERKLRNTSTMHNTVESWNFSLPSVTKLHKSLGHETEADLREEPDTTETVVELHEDHQDRSKQGWQQWARNEDPSLNPSGSSPSEERYAPATPSHPATSPGQAAKLTLSRSQDEYLTRQMSDPSPSSLDKEPTRRRISLYRLKDNKEGSVDKPRLFIRTMNGVKGVSATLSSKFKRS